MKEGYKETPVGIIPEDWAVMRIGDVANLKMGQSPSSEAYNDQGNGLFLVQGNADIKNRKTSPRIWTSEITKECAIGDIIMTVRAPVGSVAKSHHRACIGRGVCAINSKTADQDYLYHFLVNYETSWKSLEQGSTFTAVNGKDIAGVLIPCPSMIEQSKIASILSTVDDKIDSINQRIEETQKLKQGLMQQLLTRGIGHTRFKDSPLGEIPESWEVINLFKTVEVKGRIGYRGYTKEDLVKKGQGALTIGAKHINGNSQLVFNDPEYIKWEKYEESPEIKVKNGDILIVQRGSIGKVALVNQLPEPATINPSMVLVKNIKCNSSFLFYFLNSNYIQDMFRKIVTSTAVPMISQEQIKNLLIAMPNNQEQNDIAEILSTLDRRIDLISEKKIEYEQLKKGLMQQLLTGTTRVTI